MEVLLLYLTAFVRPLAGIKYGAAVFDVISIAIFTLLIGALLMNSALRKSLILTAVDAIIVGFVLWCVLIYLIYFEVAHVRDVAKLVLPMLSYIVVKNVIRDRTQYYALLSWSIWGFAITTFSSAWLIVTGQGLDYVSYWTGVPRWQGIYTHSHNLGHSMTLLLIVLVLYWALRKWDGRPLSLRTNALLMIIGVTAAYCLYMSEVRSALLGFLLFAAISLYHYNKKMLLTGAAVLGTVAVASAPFWIPALLPEYAMRERGIEVTTMELGSGRPGFWLNDLKVFAGLAIDQQLAGAGIGARADVNDGEVLYGHNDWLEILTQTGAIGFVLFIALQIVILRAILRIRSAEKYLYLALFVAVNFMMLVSNSYAWRIQVSHLYYMILAFIEMPFVRREEREWVGIEGTTREAT